MRVLVECGADVASGTIARAMRRLGGFEAAPGTTFDGHPVEASAAYPDVRLVRIDALHIHAEALDARLAATGLTPDLIVFLSRHASASGTPSLTVHPVGNFGPAELGGAPDRFTPAPGRWMTATLRALRQARDAAGYEAQVTYEVTHHGPLLDAPAFFVELGSSEPAWRDPSGGHVVAEAVLAAVGAKPPPEHPVLLGLGGGHYAPRFTEAALTRPVAYGHLWPRHRMGPQHPAAELLPRLVAATPGVAGVHWHQVPAEARSALAAAAEAAGLPDWTDRLPPG